MPKLIANCLTPLAVRNAGPGRHADGQGLYLVVKLGGTRSWVYRYMLHGRSRDVGLGSAGPGGLTLAKAREQAMILRLKVRSGIDPLAERERLRAAAAAEAQAAGIAAVTFRDVAEAYLGKNGGSWRNAKHRQQWRNTLSHYAYPVLGDLPVASIDTAHVLAVIEPIWSSKPETASRVRGRIETIIDAAKARGYRSAENPARWRGHIAQLLPARQRLTRGHHKAVAIDVLPPLVTELRCKQSITALALEFTILTVTRTSEVLGATWDEVDIDQGIWTIPAARMKAGREHRVPLSFRAIALLASIRPLGSTWLFPSPRGGRLSGMTMAMLLRRMGYDATVHGFRSTFRDWAAERTAYPKYVCDMALAHSITASQRSRTKRYQRSSSPRHGHVNRSSCGSNWTSRYQQHSQSQAGNRQATVSLGGKRAVSGTGRPGWMSRSA